MTRPPPPHVASTGPVTTADLRAALCFLEPDDPALQSMLNASTPLGLPFLVRVVENTLPLWRVVMKDRRVGLWAAVGHFFETEEGQEREEGEEGEEEVGKGKGRDERLAILGGLLLRIVEAETRLHPSEGRRDADLLNRQAQLLALLSALLRRFNKIDAAVRPKMPEHLLQKIRDEMEHLVPVDGSTELLPPFVELLAHDLRARLGKDNPQHSTRLRAAFRKHLFQAVDKEEPYPLIGKGGMSVAHTFVDKLISLDLSKLKLSFELCFLPLLEDVLRKLVPVDFKNVSDYRSRLLRHLFSVIAAFDKTTDLSGTTSLANTVCSDTASLLASLLPLKQPLLIKRAERLTDIVNQINTRRDWGIPIETRKRFLEALASLADPAWAEFVPLSRWKAIKTSLRKLVPSSRKGILKEAKPAYSPLLPLPASLDEPSTVFSSSIAVISAAPSPPNLPYFAFDASITSFPSPSDHSPPLPCLKETRNIPRANYYPSNNATFVKRVHWRDGSEDGDKKEVVVKSGDLLTLEEADVMRYIAAVTSVPVPGVLAVEQDGVWNIIYMSLIEGTNLSDVFDVLSPDDLTRLEADLKAALTSLRALKPPPGFIGGLYEPFYYLLPCSKLHDASASAAIRRPCTSSNFRNWTDLLLRACGDAPEQNPFGSSSSSSPSSSDLSLVHGDLAGRNIIIDPSTGELRALIDWERAAWWPVEVERWAVSGEEEMEFLVRCLQGVEGSKRSKESG